MLFPEPVSFQEADDFLRSRQNTATHLGTREIAMAWDAEARQAAFFSARVTQAAIVSRLHDVCQSVLSGQMSRAQARRLLREYFLGEGADALAAMGFAPARRAMGISQLASLPRLELIIYQNVKMAQERGHYQQWLKVKQDFPYGIWRVGNCQNHREAHLARDGKIYAFDHPIWTQSPPGGEFNCHCYRELLSEKDMKERGLSPEPLDSEFEPSSLGFDPSRPLADEPVFGRTTRQEYANISRKQCEEEKPRVQAELEQRQQEQAKRVEAAAQADAAAEQARQTEAAEAARKAAEEAARKEAERIAAEEATRQAEAARLEAERKAAEEAARVETERLSAEEATRQELKHLAAEEAARKAAEEASRLEAEKKASEEAARQEQEHLVTEKAAQSTEQQAISEQQTIYDITDSKKDKQNKNNSKISPLAPPVNESKEQSIIRLSKIADIVKHNIEVIFGENTCLITDKWFPEEEKIENDETHILGKCIPISDVRISSGTRYITYISSKAQHPLITATHEHIHALIDSGFFSLKALQKVEEALKHTRTYYNCRGDIIRGSKHEKRVNEEKHYKSYYRTEMLVRALTWFACVYSTDEKIQEEVLAYLENEDKLHEIDRDPNVWHGFKKNTDIYDTELEQVIMKRISKPSWFVKFLQKIGFADFTEDKDDWYIKWYDETYKGKTREEIRREAEKRLEGIPMEELVKRNPEVFGEM